MMDFKSMQEKLERARIQAALAAKKLSLNEMAKEDDYIHSEGLNVGGGSAHSASASANNNGNGNGNGNGNRSDRNNRRRDRREAASILDEVDAVNASFDESINGGRGGTTSRGRDPHRHMDGYSFGITMTMNRGDHKSTSNDSDDDDDDDDSVDSFDPEKDPLLQMAHQATATAAPTVVSNNNNKKDPNRFMADLDARERLPSDNEPPPCILPEIDKNSIVTPTNCQQQQQQQQPGGNLLESFSNSDNKMNWFRNIASPKLQESFNNVIKQVPGNTFGIGSKYNQVNQNDNDNNNNNSNDIEMNTRKKVIKTRNGEDIHVISSSSLALGDAENAELERLNQLMNKSNNNFITSCLGLVEKNRYYLFILLTFILTTFGYLYTRKRTDESVT